MFGVPFAEPSKETFQIFIVFFTYYAMFFIEGYISLRLFSCFTKNSLIKNNHLFKDKKQFSKAYKNILLCYLVGLVCLMIYTAVANGDFLLSLGLFLLLPIISRTTSKGMIYLSAIMISFFVGVIIHYFFTFKKIEISVIKRAFLALILSLLSAPYVIIISYEDVIYNGVL